MELKKYVQKLTERSNIARFEQVQIALNQLKIRYDCQIQSKWDGSNIIVGSGRGLLVCAHHDSKQHDGFSCPGANDNASGVAVLLSLSDYFRENYDLVSFAFFAEEEKEMDGSHYYVSKMPLPTAVLCLEWVGNGNTIGIYPNNNTALYDLLSSTAEMLSIPYLTFPSIGELYSDDVPFREKGIDAHCISLITEEDYAIVSKYEPKTAEETRTIFRQLSIAQIYHSPQDTAEKIQEASLQLAFEFAKKTIEDYIK